MPRPHTTLAACRPGITEGNNRPRRDPCSTDRQPTPSKSGKLLAIGLLSVLIHGGALAENDARSVLAEQGNYWLDRNDPERAAEAWKKLLLLSPNDPKALYGLGRAALAAKKTGEAESWLQKLRQQQPDSPLGTQLAQEITLASEGNQASLEEARELAATGNVEAALEKYRSVLKGSTPSGSLGREYYTFLGYTPGNVQEAISGLQRLLKESPNDPQLQLALARHLARPESTRLQGITELARLAGQPGIGAEATKSWRDALTWLGTTPGPQDLPYLQNYLKTHPDDKAIQAQYESGTKALADSRAAATRAARQPADPLRERTNQAMQQLEKGDPAQALAEFRAVLATRPNDSEALGGIGVILMRQGRWTEARDYLQRARKGNAAWQGPLNTATYWVNIQQADALKNTGKFTEARKLLEQAQRLNPKDTTAQAKLADLLLAEGKYTQADAAYQAILKNHPRDPNALRGLAESARVSGHLPQARKLLEDALRSDPGNPWVRLQLAQIYQDTGYPLEARALVEGPLLTHPNDPDALYAYAVIADRNNQTLIARQALERIPPGARSADAQALLASTDRRLAIAQAVGLGKAGRKAEALGMLARIEGTTARSFETDNALALAYTDLGDYARSLALLQTYMLKGGQQGIDAGITYVNTLLQANQDTEAAAVIQQLQARNLSTAQRGALDAVLNGYRVAQADRLRARGDLVNAYTALAPVLAANPADPGANEALARMYAAAGRMQEAQQIYDTLLAAQPDNPQLHVAAAQLGQQMRNKAYTNRHAEQALALAPDNPVILGSVARLYRAEGKTREAATLLERALAVENQRAHAAGLVNATQQPRPAINPFAGVPTARQSLQAQPRLPVPALARTLQPVAQPAMYPAQPGMPASAGPSGVLLAQAPIQPVVPVPAPASPGYPASAAAYAAPVPAYTPPQPGYTAPPPAYGYGAGSVDAVTGVPRATPAVPPASANAYAGNQPWTLPVPGVAQNTPVQVYNNPFAGSVPGTGLPPNTDPNSPAALVNELNLIHAERSGQASAGLFGNQRSGTAGTSQLTTLEAPVQMQLPLGDGRVGLNVTPVSLDPGTMDSNPYVRGTYGSGPIALEQNPALPGTVKASGVGVALTYKLDGISLDAGVTPMGFQYQTFTGGALFEGTLDQAGTVGYRFDISRRPVTESALSYAGVRDDRTGLEWGGVSATGARATLSKDFGDSGIYGSAAWHDLRGTNVARNQRNEFNLGTYFHLINEADSRLTVGLNLNSTSFKENLSHFTYGQGGYFSPQSYYELSIPFTWAQRQGAFSYKIGGAVGVQRFNQDASPLFPNNPEMQLAAVGALARMNLNELNGVRNGYYESNSKTGFSYNLNASAEYQVSPSLVLGASLAADNANDYNQWGGGLYMRYHFDQQSKAPEMPVKPFSSPFTATYGR